MSVRRSQLSLVFAVVVGTATATLGPPSAYADGGDLMAMKPVRADWPFGAVRVSVTGRRPDPAVPMDSATPQYLLDGRPYPFRFVQGTPWIVDFTVGDGKVHTLTLNVPRTDGGTYRQDLAVRAVRPLVVTAPKQSAATARKRGVLVRLNASQGFYRATSRSAKIPGAGNVRITGEEGGRGSVRLKGSYMARIRPGTKMRVQVRHIVGSDASETKNVTVTFR